MTEQMAKEFIQGKLDCMNQCDVFDCKGTDECDSCNYCYSQGNFGEQKHAFEVAISALRKQIPQKPVRQQGFPRWGYCPVCGKTVTRHSSPVGCTWCLQKLDWSEE
jgi:hypothetical protein